METVSYTHLAQAAARQRQSGAIVLPEGKPIIFLSSEEAARDRLTGASTAIVTFAFAVAFRRPGVRCGEREKSIVGKREQIGGCLLYTSRGFTSVRSGEALTLFAMGDMTEPIPGIAVIPLSPPTTVEYGVAWKQDNQFPPLRAFLDYLLG